MKTPEKTQSVRINQKVAKNVKLFVVSKGGSIKKLLEYGAVWAMTDGREQYIEYVKNDIK